MARIWIGLAAGAILALMMAGTASAKSCEELKGLKLDGGEVTAAEQIASGSVGGARGPAGLPVFCRVTATLSGAPGSKIGIEAWLPLEGAWNGKMLGTGNGGFAGSIRTDQLAAGLRRNYAAVNTDMGTAAAGGSYARGIGQTEMMKDWGWRSTHMMTVAGKQITQAYYGATIQRAYFAGCSTGGHQALMEAQRYPNDYDGILAGAAGNNRIGLHLAFLYYPRLSHDNPGFWFSPVQARAVRTAVIAKCAGKGSGLPTDDFVANPGACDFDPKSVLCAVGANPDTCLTAAQVEMLTRVYRGVVNPRNGKTIYPGLPFGTEAMISLVQPNGTLRTGGIMDLALADRFDPNTYDFDKDVTELYKSWGPDVNALSADLSAFRKHGGKLITYHGWQDTTVSPFDSINYYERLPGARSFARLFMAPGMGHCQGGPGLDSFGGAENFQAGQATDPDHDLLGALDLWVTKGVAPEKVIASKYSAPAGGGRGGGAPGAAPAAAAAPPAAVPPAPRTVIATRPLCAYPKVARYDGKGDPTRAESFSCVAGPKAKFSRPAAGYLTNSGAGL